MGDHTHQMAALILEDKGRTKLSLKAPPLNQIPIWQAAVRALMINIRTYNLEEIEEARISLKRAQKILKEHEKSLWRGKKDANKLLFEDHISESIRRLCAYARDFGEIILNMLSHESMITESRNE